MPRKPNGEKAMTGAERVRAHRARKKKINPLEVPVAAHLGAIQDRPPIESKGRIAKVVRVPSWRNLAAPGSLLKGAK